MLCLLTCIKSDTLQHSSGALSNRDINNFVVFFPEVVVEGNEKEVLIL